MRQYLVDYFSKSNLIDTFDTPKKKKKKVHFIDMKEEMVRFRELSRISHILPWRVIDVLR